MSLVLMKAGRMSFDGKKVSADPRKGKLELRASPEESHICVIWSTEGEQPSEELNLVITAESTLERVQAAKTGRVYILKQSGSEVRHFFWGQDQDEATEAQLLVRFNLFLNSPDSATALAVLQAENEEDEFFVENEEADGMWAPPTAAPIGAWQPTEAETVGEGEGEITQEELIAMVRRAIAMQSGEEGEELDIELGEEDEAQPLTSIGVEELLTPNEMRGLLDEADAVEELRGLIPEGHTLEDTIKSSQLSAAMRQLTEAIYSEGLDTLFTSLGLDDAVGLETRHPFKAFCLAMQRKYGQQ